MPAPESSEKDTAAGTQSQPVGFAKAALEHLFAFSPNGIFVTDASGTVRNANPRASELFGYSHTELIGKSIEDLVPEAFRHGHPDHRQNDNAALRHIGVHLNLFGLRKDG